MPSLSAAQHRLMAMAARRRGRARGKLPPREVAEEFLAADAGRKERSEPPADKPRRHRRRAGRG